MQPTLNITKDLSAKVGGFLGIGKTHSTSNVTIEKNVFTVGETIKVRISCNNTACSKSIKGFKLKLLRNIQATCLVSDDGAYPQTANHQRYINVVKDTESVAAHEMKDLEVEMQIPQLDDYNPPNIDQVDIKMRKDILPETFPMLGNFSSSFFGQICKVWYTLKVFVKHDAWNEWGEGHAIEFPIRIYPQRMAMPQGAAIP